MTDKFITLTDQLSINEDEIISALNKGSYVTFQYSKTIYNVELLQRINRLCKIVNENLTIRFYQYELDCECLKYLPNVKSLKLDCRSNVSNFEYLKRLEDITHLSIGIDNYCDTDFLNWENLYNLKYLKLNKKRTGRYNLKYLENYSALENIYIHNHTKNIEAIGKISSLKGLVLSLPRKTSIRFVNDLKKLKSLTLALGGRDNFDEITNYKIEEIRIMWVRGFSSFENLSNFKNLKKLEIEDQKQLNEIVFNKTMPKLKDIRLLNCKTLNKIEGLINLPKLNHLWMIRINADFDEFIKQPLPPYLETLGFTNFNVKADDLIAKRLIGMGYRC